MSFCVLMRGADAIVTTDSEPNFFLFNIIVFFCMDHLNPSPDPVYGITVLTSQPVIPYEPVYNGTSLGFIQ